MCKSGKVSLLENRLKASSGITVGNVISVRKNGYTFQFEVLKLLQKRVSAPKAQEAYRDITPIEEMNKYEDWFVGKASSEQRQRGAGRPTKKERREIESFKDDRFFFDD